MNRRWGSAAKLRGAVPTRGDRAPSRAGRRRRPTPVRLVAATAAVSLALLAGCSPAADADPARSGSPTALPVVASTNVWGDVARQIGGDQVAVTSLIADPSQDPHAFHPSGRDELAVTRAKVVIVNGGGYDDFLVQMLDAAGPGTAVVNAVEAASSVPSVDADNEHIWFNLDAVQAVAERLADIFSDSDPGHAKEFRANAAKFADSLDPIRAALTRIAAQYAGEPVAVTEPLPLYLVQAAGLHNVTPDSFTEAVEEGIGVSPSDMADVLALFSERRVRLLIFNEQAANTQAEQALSAARQHDIPVVSVGEVLPRGSDYQQWIVGIVDQISARLASGVSP